jgi:hypothetical protein
MKGMVSGINALHNTLKLFYYGLLSVVPGECAMPLYLVSADYAADTLRAAIESGGTHQYFNIAHRRDQVPTLDEFVDAALAAFNEHEDFRRRNILKPLYCDLAAFEILSQAMVEMGRGLIQQATVSIRPFAKQLYVSKSVCNEKAVQLIPDRLAPDLMHLVRKMCDFLVEKKWSRKYEPVAAH